MKVAVVGLGSMGRGIAVSVLKAGHEVWGLDLNADAAERFRADGGAAGTPDPGMLDAVVSVVLNASQTEAVLFGEGGMVPAMREGALAISCATVPPAFARDMAARCGERGVHYLDAPMSGGAAKAMDGQLTYMASGSKEAFAAAKPILDASGGQVFDLGREAGLGSAMKAVNQMLAGVHIAAMAEAMTFGIGQGISPGTFLEVIPQCAGTSWMLENRGPHIRDGDYSPRSAVDIWPKDLGIVSDIARVARFPAPLTAAALQQFLAASANGLGAEDDAAVAKVYARNGAVDLA